MMKAIKKVKETIAKKTLNKPVKANLCKCLYCDTVLIDKSPQAGAKEYTLTGNEIEMQYTKDKESGEYFWACPICGTDSYLVGLPFIHSNLE